MAGGKKTKKAEFMRTHHNSWVVAFIDCTTEDVSAVIAGVATYYTPEAESGDPNFPLDWKEVGSIFPHGYTSSTATPTRIYQVTRSAYPISLAIKDQVRSELNKRNIL